MAIPTIHIDISGTVVAFYAAAVATVTAIVQTANFFRDRMYLKIKVLLNRQIIGDPRRDPNKSLIQINVTNAGRRPITLTGVGATRLFPCKTHFVIRDITPDVPRELTEGKYVDAFLPQDEINLAEIRSWEAYTSTGRTFRFHLAPLRKRLVSDWRWKRHFKEEAKKQSEAGTGAGKS